MTTTHTDSRCGIHGNPTHPVPRCSACDRTLPYWHELVALPTLTEGWASDLRIDTGTFRVWTARTGLADGEPFEHTVYVETYLDRTTNHGPDTGWNDLGHYDGDNPPRSLPGVTPHDLAGEVTS